MTLVGRLAAVGAVTIAIVAVAIIVLSGGSGYQVKAVFDNASQLVNGDEVQVAGAPVGSVSQIKLTPDGQAQLTLTINDSSYEPLHQGTSAVIRLTSLTGIANRYIELRMGPGNAPTIPNNGVIGTTNTTSAVDLDELFDTLNQPTRKGLQDVFQGSAASVNNQGAAMQRAFQYLNPAIASSSVLFSELNRDTHKFTRFITANSQLVTDLASRSSSLSGLVSNLSTVMGALASQHTNLGTALQRLPGFMQYANTTFVNLRQLLTDLTPLVNASKPVAAPLNVWLQTLRPLAVNAVPTVADLARTICQPQAYCTVDSPGYNDLIQLVELQPALAGATVRNVFADGKWRQGAFPISTKALNESEPELATARPYAADLTGWFEGFTHPGVIDANGGTSRIASNNVNVNPGSNLPGGLLNTLTKVLPTLPLGQQITTFLSSVSSLGITARQGDRCPGSVERGALWDPYTNYGPNDPRTVCNPNQRPTGR
jgi:phospholipid/cholesterol/gamma-HCH transport system substrate-binding protein